MISWVNDPNSLVVFYRLTDEQYDYVMTNNQWHLDADFIQKALYSNGNNALITLLISKKSLKSIYRLLRNEYDSYSRIGFWNRNHKKFIKLKG